jgi:hypothetical protein
MADLDDDTPPAPPVRNESTRFEHFISKRYLSNNKNKNVCVQKYYKLKNLRNFTSFYSTNSASSTSGSISTTSTNNTTSSSNSSPNIDKPLPKTPDDEEMKKKSKCKYLRLCLIHFNHHW